MQTANQFGKTTKKIVVKTNDPDNKQVILTLQGHVLVPFKAQPRFAQFRNIEEGTTPQPVKVNIRRGDGAPLKLELMRIPKPGVEVDLQEIKPGEHYQLVIGINPPQRPGKLRTWVKLKTGVPEAPEKTVPIHADIPSSWAPSELASATP